MHLKHINTNTDLSVAIYYSKQITTDISHDDPHPLIDVQYTSTYLNYI